MVPQLSHFSLVCMPVGNLQVHHRKEPKQLLTANQTYLSLTPGSGSNIELDIVLARPWSLDIYAHHLLLLMVPQLQEDKTGRRTSMRKITIQADHLFKMTHSVLEQFGHWGEKADNYLDQLSKRPRDETGGPNKAKF